MNTFQYNNDDISITESGEEKFIVNIRTGKLIKLNKTGRIIWDRIPGSTIESLTEDICNMCEVDRDRVRNDINTYIAQLKKEEFVIETAV